MITDMFTNMITDMITHMITNMITHMTTHMITGIGVYRRAELKTVDQRSQIVLQLRKGSIITPECSKVASRYNSQLLWPSGTWLDDRIGTLWGERAIWANSILFRQTSQWKRINRQPANTYMCPFDGIRRGFLGIQWRWFPFCSRGSQDPQGYQRIDRLGTLRRPVDSVCI
jgi:hypothetical protein